MSALDKSYRELNVDYSFSYAEEPVVLYIVQWNEKKLETPIPIIIEGKGQSFHLSCFHESGWKGNLFDALKELFPKILDRLKEYAENEEPDRWF